MLVLLPTNFDQESNTIATLSINNNQCFNEYINCIFKQSRTNIINSAKTGFQNVFSLFAPNLINSAGIKW